MITRQEMQLYEQLNKALDVLRTPEGHNSGAYQIVWRAIRDYCPDVYDESARRTQQRAGGENTFGT
jgi:hypothetical protein